MHPIHDLETPLSRGGYMPYFYERGLHLHYAMPTERGRSNDSGAYAVYAFSQDQGPLHGAERPQTIEQVVARGYFAVPDADSVTAILTDKVDTSRMGLDDVIGQIRQRYELYERHFHQLQLAKCAATNAIYQHDAYRGAAQTSARQHYAKHKAIQDLYAQEREERVNLWRDVSRLKLQLPESAQGYLAAHRKVSALNAGLGDLL